MATEWDRGEPSGQGPAKEVGRPPWESPAAGRGVPGAVPWIGDGAAEFPSGDGGRGRRRRWGCLVGGSLLAVALLGIVATGVNIVMKNFGSSGGAASSGFDLDQAPSSAELAAARQFTDQFLQAWAGGDAGRAAGLTDDPAAAKAALTAYRSGLDLRKLVLTADGGTRAAMGNIPAQALDGSAAIEFRVSAKATVAAGGLTGVWAYRTQLLAYKLQGRWCIGWEPEDLAPNLDSGDHLAAVAVPPDSGSPTATDSSGNPLSGYGDPGLSAIAAKISPRAATGKGTPGLEVDIEDASNAPLSDLASTVSAPVAGKAATTISATAERAAQAAVRQNANSAMVVIQPSTGHILAIANNAQDNDFALTAQVSPGSVMKIVTATALLNAGTVTTTSPVSCPPAETVGMQTFRNDAGESEPSGTPFATDFAMSCNNAFTQFSSQLSGGKLAATARDYYGLGLPWTLGLAGQPAAYFSAPSSPSAAELAQETFGEGLLTTCPLAMASVAATVDTGQFRQPELVPGMAAATASPLPAGTDEQLQAMMRDVVTEGTAASVGFGPDVYAKTGTADIDGQEQSNAWLAAYDPGEDVAVAALVLNSGDGAAVAGPEVKAFLAQY
jgi:hypothetical protein